MDSDDISIEEKCENLMSIVVESRKRFGKMCIEYDAKVTLLENKMLNKRLDNISKYQFKLKQPITEACYNENNKFVDDFKMEIEDKEKRLEEMKRKIVNTKNVVAQLKRDHIAIAGTTQPLIASVMLARAKKRLESKNI